LDVPDQRDTKSKQQPSTSDKGLDSETISVASGSNGSHANGDAMDNLSDTRVAQLHLFAPVAKLVRPDGESGATEKAKVKDAEWGLGLEKPIGPDTVVDEQLFAKLAHFQKLKEEQGTHFNQSLSKNRSFRNPHIYNKLVQWVEVEETASEYSSMIKEGKRRADDIWNSSRGARIELKRQGGKDAIASLQKRRQEESDERKRKGRREKIDFVGTTSKTSTTTSSSHHLHPRRATPAQDQAH
jgi:hypothetical protein